MNLPRLALPCLAALALAALPARVGAQDIYKCTQGGQLTYTDHPCPAGKGELLHQADSTETIDQYLRLGEDTKAEAWAKAHHLEDLYRQRLALRDDRLKAQAEQARQGALAAQQQAAQAREQAAAQAQQQALAAQAAQNAQLQAENAALRQQNASYQSALSQPVYAPVVYGGVAYPPHRGDHHGDRDDHHHGGDTPPPVTGQLLFKNCSAKAGGRVGC